MFLTAEKIEVSAGEHVLLRDFGLHIEQGEVVAIQGPSGAGKTTLLETLAHLRPAGPGRIALDGKDPRTWKVPLFRRKVMFVSGRPMFTNETIRSVLARPFSYKCAPSAFDEAAAQTLLDAFWLNPGLDTSANALSAGEAQRVALVRALLLHPSFCLLDEPTSALDPEHRKQVLNLLMERVERGSLGIVLICHDPADRETLGARTLTPNWIREPNARSDPS